MERLTKKYNVITRTTASVGETEYVVKEDKFGKAINKLGKLEDIMEKYGIESAEYLDNIINSIRTNTFIDIENKEILELENANLKSELAELKQKAIMSKFRTYQPIFYITQYYTSTKGNPEYDIISDKYYVAENENEIILGWNYAKDFNQRKYYYVCKDWVFATLEEAEQKLAEIKGE